MKIKIKKRWIFICILSTAAILFLTVGTLYGRQAKNLSHCVTIQTTDTGFSVDLIQQMMDDPENTDTFCAWQEENECQLSSYESQRPAVADVIAVYGPSRCVLPYGKNLQPEDSDGCIIGIKLAEELFGSHIVEGQKLIYGDRILTVRGVVDAPERAMICEAFVNTEEEIRFDHINILLSEGSDRSLIGTDFMNRYGLSAQILRFDLYQNLSWLKELIPGKWADFDGWKDNIEQKKQEILQVNHAKKSVIEAKYLSEIKKRNVFVILGICSMGAAFAVMRCRSFATHI